MSRKYFSDFYLEVRAGNAVAKRFEMAGVVPFPEVDLARASFITKIPEKRILRALQNRELAGRRVYDAHLIRIVDLWHFAAFLEKKKMKRKNHR